MLEDRLTALFKNEDEYAIQEKMKGSTLVGRKYCPLFPYFQHLKSDQPDQGAFRVVRSVFAYVQLQLHMCPVEAWWVCTDSMYSTNLRVQSYIMYKGKSMYRATCKGQPLCIGQSAKVSPYAWAKCKGKLVQAKKTLERVQW